MAKDKSKTTTDLGFAKPSEAPAGGDSWSITDGDEPQSGKNDGSLFLLTPLRTETVKTQQYGDKEVIVADVVELDEKKPAKSVEHTDVYVFGGWLQGALRGFIGKRQVLGRLAKTPDKTSGRGYVWKFEDADPDDVKVALAYKDSIDPFAQSGATADGDEPEAGKKKGKKAKG